MQRKILFASVLALAGITTIVVARATTSAPRMVPFDELTLTLELNATDLDSGVLLHSDTEESLARLTIQDPTGHKIFDMKSDDPLDLGVTELFWESAEPDIETALAAYPAGEYAVTAKAFDGTIVQGVARLSHVLPARPTITAPDEGDQLDVNNVLMKWNLDPSVEHYWLEIKGEEQPEMTIHCLPGADHFQIPAELLLPSSRYQVGLGAQGANGNVTLRSVDFSTLP
jgi:hypothetical protein